MKANKLFRKLALSGVALGAAAVTLTATTFAWYTQNNEVSVTSVSGLTTTEADTGSIYISAATHYTNATDLNVAATSWSTPGSSADPTKVVDGTLAPVNYADYKKLTGATIPDGGSTKTQAVYGNFSAGDIIQYRLRLRAATAGSEMAVYLSDFQLDAYKLTVANQNTTETKIAAKTDLPTQIGLATSGGVTENTAYGADIRKALKMTVAEFDRNASGTEEQGTTDASGYALAASRTTVYGFTNYAVEDNALAAPQNGSIDALDYYNQVTGSALSRPAHYFGQTSGENPTDIAEVSLKKAESEAGTLNSGTAQQFITIPATGYVEVLITFWLDGWDEYCFDVMRSQKFTCSMKFTSSVGSATVAK